MAYMDKAFYKACIEKEVYEEYRKSKNRLTIFDKLWCKYLSPSGNAVYLVRRKQYLEHKGAFGKFLGKLYHVKLVRRYSIHINSQAEIGIGLHIVHPMCVIVSLCKIGENFTVYQNCTVGAKKREYGATPEIGSNVTMYSGSSVIGKVHVADNVVIGAQALLVKDADEPGVYCGIPARLLSGKSEE